MLGMFRKKKAKTEQKDKNFELLPEREADLDRMVSQTGAASREELVHNALDFLKVAVKVKKGGEELAAVDDQGGYSKIKFGPLERVRPDGKE